MAAELRQSGLEPVGSLPWGSHFCEFYHGKQDLIDTLVPFFVTGLRENELCIWVTSDVLERGEAEALLADALPEYPDYVSRGQIEIYDHREWYVRAGSKLPRVLDQWLAKEQEALERGFDGLRLTGDTSFVHRSGWNGFVEYERTVNEAFVGFRLIGLCTYNVSRCTASDVLDVMRNHQFALTRRHGEWELLEQASLKIAKDELERRVQERTQALETALRGRDEFLAMLGHELRNPLAPIRTAAELLRLGSKEPEVAKLSEILERQTRHMSRLLDDLLDVARITHGRIRLDLRALELNRILEEALDGMRANIEAHGHRLTVSVVDQELPMRGDPTRLTQIFSNLLDNAIKYTPYGGRIVVDLCREGEEAVVTISDSGIGISSEMLPMVFELFAQGARSVDRPEGGLGLGLAVVRNLVEMHGGSVTASSAGQDRGSTFRVRLPLDQSPGHESADDAGAEVTRIGGRVLIIDDNLDAAESLAMLLQMKGHEVHIGGDGESALALALQHRPHAMVLDIGLPGMDGFEVARRLRANEELRGLRLVAVTGYGQNEQRSDGADFDAYLVKPIDADTLEHALFD